MQRNQTIKALFAGLSIAFTCAGAQADELDNAVRIGYAGVSFNTKSGDLSGPPGTTPPGIQVGLKNTDLLALSYERRLSDQWSVMLQAGTPPIIHVQGAGNAAALGSAVTARTWFPAVLVNYTFASVFGVRPYVGAGVNYTFFTDRQVSAAYTNAVQGTSSSIKMKSSLGPVVRLGAEYPIDKNWAVEFGYLHYWIKTTATITTATPGFGNIVRTVDTKANPDVLGLTLGYRF